MVEALEVPGAPLLAVQWHPEDTAATSPEDHALFAWVVEAGTAAAGRLRRALRGGCAVEGAGCAWTPWT